MDLARSGEDELTRYAFDPIENAGDLGRTGLLSILRPIEGLERELDQAGVHSGDACKLLARLSDVRPVVLSDQHPGFDHLIEITLSDGIRERVADKLPAKCLLNVLRFLARSDHPALRIGLEHLVENQGFQKSRAGHRNPSRFIGIAIKNRLRVNSTYSVE